MTPQTNILMNVSAQTGVLTGAWFNTARFYSGPNTPIELDVAVTAGTATVILEGTNDPTNDQAIQIASVSATGHTQAPRFSYIRARLSAATAAAVRVTSDKPVKQAS